MKDHLDYSPVCPNARQSMFLGASLFGENTVCTEETCGYWTHTKAKRSRKLSSRGYCSSPAPCKSNSKGATT